MCCALSWSQAQNANVILGEQLQELAFARDAFHDELAYERAAFGDLLLRRAAIDGGLCDAGGDLPLEPADTLHEEVVEVRTGDRQELDSLEEWVALVLGLAQHALGEGQPGQLAVEVQTRVSQVVGDGVRTGGRAIRGWRANNAGGQCAGAARVGRHGRSWLVNQSSPTVRRLGRLDAREIAPRWWAQGPMTPGRSGQTRLGRPTGQGHPTARCKATAPAYVKAAPAYAHSLSRLPDLREVAHDSDSSSGSMKRSARSPHARSTPRQSSSTATWRPRISLWTMGAISQ